MPKQIINTPDAPKAVGPYSQAIRSGDLVFCSGQVGIDPGTGKIEGPTAAIQAKQVLANLKAVLAAAGVTPGDVVRTTIYLVDMTDFASVNEIYAGFFGENRPARATVAVAGLPLAAKVEIDCIAIRPGTSE